MKNKIIILFFLVLSLSEFTLAQSTETKPVSESVKKAKLKEVKFIGEIIPNYPSTEYSKTIDYVSVNLLATCDGKSVSSSSTSDVLTLEQKNILNTVDIDTNIGIEIKFKYKDSKNDDLGGNNKVKEMAYLVKVIN